MDLVKIYNKIIIDSSISWVLFKHGTCVMLTKPGKDIRAQAINILKKHGSVMPGTPSGDFEVTKIPDLNGWVIIGDSPGIIMYVPMEEIGNNKSDFEIGMIGRTKRDLDGNELEVVHSEDRRKRV